MSLVAEEIRGGVSTTASLLDDIMAQARLTPVDEGLWRGQTGRCRPYRQYSGQWC